MKADQQLTVALTGSIEFETMKKHLSNMLDEWEAQFETGTEYSYESKKQYIQAAEYMKSFGRTPTLIAEVAATL